MSTSSASDTRLYRRKPDVEEAPLQGELMLFDPASARFFVLNRTMAFVWRRCDGTHTLARMIEGLPAEFAGAPAESAPGDLARALEELLALGLLVDSA